MTIGALGTTASHEVADLTGVNVMSVSRAVSALGTQWPDHGRPPIRSTAAARR